LQLQKIAMLDVADVVVVNKADLAGAPRAASEVAQRLGFNHSTQRVMVTQAKRHRDKGVDELFSALFSPVPATPLAGRGEGRKARGSSV
jgi:methylmalonyl-CoA mutase